MRTQLISLFLIITSAYSRKAWLLIAAAFFCLAQNIAQNRADLESDRFAIIKNIEETEKALDDLKSRQSSALALLENLENQIASKKKLIESIKMETILIDENLGVLTNKKSSESIQLDEWITQYGKLAFDNYKYSLISDKWTLILNSASLKDALIKWRYFKQLEKHVAEQMDAIRRLNTSINQTARIILSDSEQKSQLLKTEMQLLSEIEVQAKEATQQLGLLNEGERQLKSELNRQKRKREELNLAIQNYIIKSFSSYDEVSQKLDKVNPFERKRGFHKWPVTQGRLKLRYGEQNHPSIPGVIINNQGIDIATEADNAVKSIAAGKVINVENIHSGEITIIVEHDFNYYTVYSNLDQAIVFKADAVSESQVLGSLRKNSDGQYEIHFEIRKGKTTVNPIQWLKNN